MQIIDYKILSADTSEGLQALVQAHISDGWQPVGPADVNTTELRGRGMLAPGMSKFMQTMVKYSA